MSWSAFNLTFNLYLHSLGYQQDFIGLLNGLPSIVILVCGLPIGMAADRYGYLRFMVAGSIITVAAALGMGLNSTRFGLLAFALLGGLGASLSWVIGAPMMMAVSTKEERVFLFSVQFALMMGAGFVGSLMAGALPEVAAAMMGVASTATAPLRLSYLVGAAFNLFALVPILRMTQVKGNGAVAREVAASGGARASLISGWRKSLPTTWAEAGLFAKLLGPPALVSFGAGAMVIFFQLFFNMRFKLNPGTIGVVFAFSSVINAVATLLSPVLAKRLGKVRTIVLTQLLSIPFLLILAYSFNFSAVVVAYYLRNALMNMSSPLVQIFALEKVSEGQRATLTSLNAMLGNLGRGGLGPVVSGYIQVSSGFSLAFTMTAVCYLISTVLYYLFFRNAEPAPGRARRGGGLGAAPPASGGGGAGDPAAATG